MNFLRTTALGLTLSVAGASFAVADGHAKELTIAIVNNGHMHQHAKNC
jgi:sorbitol/mannitol transport system substrate-binding protein